MFVRHNVREYDAWRRVYDGVADIQEARGVRAEWVYQSVDDPLDVTVIHDFDDLASGKAYLEASDVRAAIEEAGVVGEPLVWFTTEGS
jgi:hypothetical protein